MARRTADAKGRRGRIRSGLERFREMIAGDIPPPPMVKLLGMQLVEADEGRVVFTAEPEEQYYNGMGVVHGGLAATLLDSALGCAINTLAPPGKRFTTLELKVNFTRPLTREVGTVRCEAKAIHVGSRVATSEARVVDRHGKLYAHGTTTCIAVEQPEEGKRKKEKRKGKRQRHKAKRSN